MKRIINFLITQLMLLLAPIVANWEHKAEGNEKETWYPTFKTVYPDEKLSFNEWINNIFNQLK